MNRQHCYRCLHPERPAPACQCCGIGAYYVSGYCRVCHPRLGIPESCRTCLAWTAERLRGMCNPCYQFADHHDVGVCGTCKRTVPVGSEGVCRLCWIQASLVPQPYWEPKDLTVAARTGHQLFIAITGRPIDPPSAPPPLVVPWTPPRWRQLRICDPARDMTRARLSTGQPIDPPFAGYLRNELHRQANVGGWPDWMRDRVSWTVGLLAQVHRGDELIKASTIASFAGTTTSHNIARTVEFVADLGLLDDDRPDVLGNWIAARLGDVHPGIRTETGTWIDILRHGGPRRRARAEATIRQKIDYITPFLADISTRHTSLREVTAAEIAGWLDGRSTAVHAAVAIRDLFKTLHQQRITFADPTRSLHPGKTPKSVPIPIDRSVLEVVAKAATADPALKMTIALIGVHGMYPHQARELPLRAVDLHGGRLAHGDINRPLDDFTRHATIGYLAHRNRRWPTTTSPYLLVNHVAAHTGRPVTSRWMLGLFKHLPITPWQLREDRLLEEAAHADGDPLHLATMFGIGAQASLRYSTAVTSTPKTPDP